MTQQTPTTRQPAEPKIRYLGRTSYSVESRTRPGHMHYCDTFRLTCSCEAGRSVDHAAGRYGCVAGGILKHKRAGSYQ